jgi:hypothetical protein
MPLLLLLVVLLALLLLDSLALKADLPLSLLFAPCSAQASCRYSSCIRQERPLGSLRAMSIHARILSGPCDSSAMMPALSSGVVASRAKFPAMLAETADFPLLLLLLLLCAEAFSTGMQRRASGNVSALHRSSYCALCSVMNAQLFSRATRLRASL